MTHAWLFTGPPGSGRSVAARAFAAALLCPSGGCGECASCRQVRAGFQALAGAEPARYLVLDADRPTDEITRDIQERIRGMLPDPVPSVAEAATGDFPAIKESDEPARFR